MLSWHGDDKQTRNTCLLILSLIALLGIGIVLIGKFLVPWLWLPIKEYPGQYVVIFLIFAVVLFLVVKFYQFRIGALLKVYHQ